MVKNLRLHSEKGWEAPVWDVLGSRPVGGSLHLFLLPRCFRADFLAACRYVM